MDFINWIDKRRRWWKVFFFIFVVSVIVVGYIGYKTYTFAPPICDFVDEKGETIIAGTDITAGQQVFLSRGLMEYGSFLGDGAMRGPDFTAEALAVASRSMNRTVDADWVDRVRDPKVRKGVVAEVVRQQLKTNRHDPAYYASTTPSASSSVAAGAVVLTPAQVVAWRDVAAYYRDKFGPGTGPARGEAFKPANYVSDPVRARQLAAFFFWGAWLCAAQRPGYEYSYTHNWPYDPSAGNQPHGAIVLWSVIGVLFVIFSIGGLFYAYGKLDREAVLEQQRSKLPPLATDKHVDAFKPTATQRATYKYFAVAAILFAIQVGAGLLAIADFVGLSGALGELFATLPVTVTRAWHSQLSVLWIAVCWFAATIWVLPLICRPEPRGQLAWVNGLFVMLAVVAAGTLLGIPAGIAGAFGDPETTRWLGLQGWEFMQIGRLYHIVLYASFVVWLVVVSRGVWPVLRRKQSWSLPNWMVYSIGGMIFMFSASFVAEPDTNFVIADFWRWCTIHMWVEAFFELFTTIIVAYFLYLMGFVSHAVASRVVYLAAILFLGSGLIGIAHNFYWNAKSIETVALGGVLSSLQVAPLILLTVEAWRFRHLPQHTIARAQADAKARGMDGEALTFGLGDAFLFLVGVNFWNFFGAGVMGFIITCRSSTTTSTARISP